MKRPVFLSTIICLIGHLSYWMSGLFFLTLIFPLSFLLVPFGIQKKFLSSLLRLFLFIFIRYVLGTLQICKIEEFKGLNLLRENRGAIIVSNHCGFLDGPLILAHSKNTSSVMKSNYARRLLYSILIKKLDFICTDSSSPGTLMAAKNKIRRLLGKKRKILFFPENFRSIKGKLISFRPFAFKAAMENNVPVIPVVIHNDTPFMTKNLASFFPKRKVTFRIKVFDCVFPSDCKNAVELNEKVFKIINSDLIKMNKMSSQQVK